MLNKYFWKSDLITSAHVYVLLWQSTFTSWHFIFTQEIRYYCHNYFLRSADWISKRRNYFPRVLRYWPSRNMWSLRWILFSTLKYLGFFSQISWAWAQDSNERIYLSERWSVIPCFEKFPSPTNLTKFLLVICEFHIS